jgi:hypothetical protein
MPAQISTITVSEFVLQKLTEENGETTWFLYAGEMLGGCG